MSAFSDTDKQKKYNQLIEDDAWKIIKQLEPTIEERYQKKLSLFVPKFDIIKKILKRTIDLLK